MSNMDGNQFWCLSFNVMTTSIMKGQKPCINGLGLLQVKHVILSQRAQVRVTEGKVHDPEIRYQTIASLYHAYSLYSLQKERTAP